MRLALSLPAAILVAASVASPARAQVFVTSITASFPDSAGKVPALNAVPGSAIQNWAMGLAQGVLTHGQTYNYCVSIASATAQGKGTVSFKLARGTTVIQSKTIITGSQYTIGPNGVWYFCSGYLVLPSNAGKATLTGTVAYTATGATKPVLSKLAVPVLLQ